MEVEAMVTVVVAAAAAAACTAVRSMQKVPRSSPRYYRPNSSAIGASPPPAAQPLFSHHLFRLCALLCPPKTVPIYDPAEP
jgi:hypothetical protein